MYFLKFCGHCVTAVSTNLSVTTAHWGWIPERTTVKSSSCVKSFPSGPGGCGPILPPHLHSPIPFSPSLLPLLSHRPRLNHSLRAKKLTWQASEYFLSHTQLRSVKIFVSILEKARGTVREQIRREIHRKRTGGLQGNPFYLCDSWVGLL